MQQVLLGLAAIVGLGIGAQWLAWRLRLPAILLLLIVGFLAGPVLGLIQPDQLLGELLLPIISLSVAIILFEGGLSLDIAELRDVGRIVRNLITVGVLVTWVLAALSAWLFLDFDVTLAVLFGALLIVTGPTVIVPLLRHIRPHARIGSAVKWEGIVNDPIGAILAVLVFEAVLAGGLEAGATTAARGVLMAVLVGGSLGLAGAAAVVLLLRRYWIPDYLQSPLALSLVLLVFAAANQVQHESGLLAVTIMGAALASQTVVTVRHIVEFKENLRVLLISALFIILAARLPLSDPAYWSAGSMTFLAALILVVRPAAVAAATLGTDLSWRERVFLGFMAPRGIVAAAVASVFALELAPLGHSAAGRLVPLTFLVIVGTVTVYGVLAPLVARQLKLATPNPQGILMIGAAPWVRAAAQALTESGVKVVLADSNWANVSAARRSGLTAVYANVLTEGALERMELELDGVGRLLALTPNDEVNALATLHFEEVFDRAHVYQLPPEASERERRDGGISPHLRGRYLFHPDATHAALAARFSAGATIRRTPLTEEFDVVRYTERYGSHAVPLFALRESGELLVITASNPPTLKPGHTVIALVDRVTETDPTEHS